MKAALFTFLGLVFSVTLAHGQSRDLECKPPTQAPASVVTDRFAAGYVAAFGYPSERMRPEFLALPLADQHRQYVESEVQRRVSYLRPYLQSRNCEISDLDVFAISIYTGSQYKLLNAALRSQNSKELNKYQFLIDAINAGIDKLAPYVGTVKRGTDLTPQQAKKYCRGCVVEEKAFLSTTINNSYSKRPFQFIIQSKTGVYIAPISSAIMEDEVLFKPGTRFRVLKVQKHVITMEEVP